MSLSITDIASLAASRPGVLRVADENARTLAVQTRNRMREDALESARRASEAFFDYTPAQHAAIASLRDVHWPRARAVRSARAAVLSVIAQHFDKYDDSLFLDQGELYDLILREWRLQKLLALVNARSASVGRFPLSRADMRADKPTRFLGSAYKRHFTFAGGRDFGSAEFTPGDIVQGAFIRAIENGDTVNGVPTFGSMFRHVQAERAHLTRVANAEYGARKRAALGEVVPDDTIWEDNKHTMRLLGTRNYPTLDQHRKAVAIAHRDAEMATLDDAVTASARTEALDGAGEEFHIIVARVLMGGATLDEIADALKLNTATILRDVFNSQRASLRHITTGIDHSERSVDMHNRAEREREIDAAQAEHARIMRERRIAAETARYALSRVA